MMEFDVSTVFAVLAVGAFFAFLVNEVRVARKRRREIREDQSGKKYTPAPRPSGDVHEK